MSEKKSEPKPPKPESKEKKAKKPADPSAAPPAGEEPKAKAKAEAKPRPPADPRLKVLKKFKGRFLPKGILRERHAGIMSRWNSDPEHGGVTLEELKTLLDDWRGTREKPPRLPRA